MNRIKMKEKLKTLGILFVALILSFGMVQPAPVLAAIPSPKWMPGFPMMAGQQIIAMWMVVPGAVKYKVYLNGNMISETPAVQTMVPAPDKPGKFNFTVTAVDASGAESAPSLPGAITIITVEPPTNLTALPQGDRINIRWDSAKGALIYDLYRRNKGEGEFKQLASVQDNRYSDGDVEQNVAYEYALKSKDSAGKLSEFSTPLETIIEVIVSEDDSFKGYELHRLPIEKVLEEAFFFIPFDIEIFGTETVVTGDVTLQFIPNILESTYPEELPVIGLGDPPPRFIGVSFDSGGNILATEDNKVHRIDVATGDVIGTYEALLPEEGELVILFRKKEKEYRNRPRLTDVAEGPDGSIFATDSSNNRLVSWTTDGDWLGTMGLDPDEKVSEFPDWMVSGAQWLKVTSSGMVVANSTFRLHCFNLDREYLGAIGMPGDTVGSFGQIAGFYSDNEDRFWVIDKKNSTLQIFEENPDSPESFSFNRRWQPVFVATDETGSGNPPFGKPSTLFVGPKESDGFTYVYLADLLKNEIGKFKILWDKAGGS